MLVGFGGKRGKVHDKSREGFCSGFLGKDGGGYEEEAVLFVICLRGGLAYGPRSGSAHFGKFCWSIWEPIFPS